MPRRTNRNRRQLNPRRQWQPALLVPNHIEKAAGNAIILELNEPGELVGAVGMSYSNGPVNATVATAAQLGPTTFELTMTEDCPAGGQCTLPAYDPGIRTKRGGFVSPFGLTLSEPV